MRYYGCLSAVKFDCGTAVDYGRRSRYVFQLADNTADHPDVLTMHAENEVG